MRNALKVLFVVAFAIPTMASAAIGNTKHNLSSTGPGTVKFTDAGVDMCRFCHMPHNANTTQGALWARAVADRRRLHHADHHGGRHGPPRHQRRPRRRLAEVPLLPRRHGGPEHHRQQVRHRTRRSPPPRPPAPT